MPRKIDISHKTVIFVTCFLLGLWIIYLIRDLLILLFMAIILMSALAPLVDFFVRLKFPKAVGIAVGYAIIISILSGLVAGLLTPLINESRNLILTIPPLLAKQLNINFDQSFLQNSVQEVSRNIFSLTLLVFDNLITIVLLLVITFYLLLEKEKLEKHIANFFMGREETIRDLVIKIEEKLGAWVRGQLTLTVIIGLLSYVGLIVLGVDYALPLALLAGIMEVVPVIGPIIAAIPAIAIALTISPLLAAGVGILYFIIQQLENSLIVPQVMKRAVGLNPLVVILAIAVGGRLLGVIGGLLAVPITVVAQIIINEILRERKE